MLEIALIVLLLYTLIREAIYQYSMHKLINKLMSTNFHEYVSASEIYKPKPTQARMPDNTPEEDLGMLKDFM